MVAFGNGRIIPAFIVGISTKQNPKNDPSPRYGEYGGENPKLLWGSAQIIQTSYDDGSRY